MFAMFNVSLINNQDIYTVGEQQPISRADNTMYTFKFGFQSVSKYRKEEEEQRAKLAC